VGVPFTDYFETGRTAGLHGEAEDSAATRRYTLGATIEWRPTRAFGFELDALYHRMGYVETVRFFDSANGSFINSAIDVKGNSWDFPILAKYRLHSLLRPYLTGGGVLRHIGPVRGRGSVTSGLLIGQPGSTIQIDTSDPSALRKRFFPGVTAGAGSEQSVGRFVFMPEIRYTRWTANISGPGGLLRFAPNQVEFQLGLLF
jgi:hypothetical protein